jgi:hypothetical protein
MAVLSFFLGNRAFIDLSSAQVREHILMIPRELCWWLSARVGELQHAFCVYEGKKHIIS